MSAPWWQTAIIYQIYPRSFQDSNGDGVGDLRGIIRRLPYLAELGVDAVWLSPIFPSPMADFGYDICDYTNIDPLFGTLKDFHELRESAHALGLKLLLDLVPNHTSDQHPWFVESRSSRDSPKRDWYIWRDPAPDGGPPNNWISDFGGSSWEWDETSGQYYLHAFLKEQPDLNWRNPEVRAAMLDVMRFWFDRGVDGFRIDVLWHLIKAEGLPDNPQNPEYRPNWVIASHDYPRIAAKLGEAQARVAAMLLLTLRGTPTLYQGDELGIGKVDIPPHQVRDPKELREPGIGLGRDPSRTPMAWDGSLNAGFTTGEPWLPLHGDW